jgi:stage II sporulation protein P
MILHTHTSEAYAGVRSEYLDGVISVGDALTQRLNVLGLTAIHCTVIHDGGEGNAYISARETIEMMLRVYPSIKYVIDLHRMELEYDGVPIKTV